MDMGGDTEGTWRGDTQRGQPCGGDKGGNTEGTWGTTERPRPDPRAAGKGRRRAHLRTNLEVNLLKRLADGPRRPWLAPDGEAGGTA